MILYQVRREYEARGEQMVQYQLLAKQVLEQFEQIYIEQLPQKDNSYADALEQLATYDGMTNLTDIVVTTTCSLSVLRIMIAQMEVDQKTSIRYKQLDYVCKQLGTRYLTGICTNEVFHCLCSSVLSLIRDVRSYNRFITASAEISRADML